MEKKSLERFTLKEVCEECNNNSFNKKSRYDFAKELFREITSRLSMNCEVSIPGFGIFTVKTIPEKPAQNLKTKEKIIVPEHKKVSFKASATLKGSVK
jgi:nucleoid DNA-binding protein